jgi:hypothetical protein
VSDDAVKKQIEGVCTEISEKNDWVTFHIDVGRQYPVRLATKIEALVKAGREAKSNKAVWTFSESQGGENPNKPGTHYINRRLEKVEVGGALDPAVAGSSSSGGGHVRSPDDRHSIERQTIVKAALPLYQRKFESDDDFFAFAEKLAKFVASTPQAAPAAAAPPPAAETSGGDPAWPDTDPNDIPFLWIDNYDVDRTVRWRQ